jgi:hypothetical protein
MDPKNDVNYLNFLRDRVTEFNTSLKQFLALHDENNIIARGIAPAVFPRDDADVVRIRELTAELNVLAGKCMDACKTVGYAYVVKDVGQIDPIIMWESMTRPKPVVEPADVLGACGQVLGRLDAMVHRAEAFAAPSINTTGFHSLVWSAAQRLWRDGYPLQAVKAAADAVTAQMKTVTGRNDAPETSLWQQAFSENEPQLDKPRLRWPGEQNDKSVSNMNDGLRLFAPGVQMTIRNPAAHSGETMSEHDALERLATLSLLAKWLDQCDILKVTVDQRMLNVEG